MLIYYRQDTTFYYVFHTRHVVWNLDLIYNVDIYFLPYKIESRAHWSVTLNQAQLYLKDSHEYFFDIFGEEWKNYTRFVLFYTYKINVLERQVKKVRHTKFWTTNSTNSNTFSRSLLGLIDKLKQSNMKRILIE